MGKKHKKKKKRKPGKPYIPQKKSGNPYSYAEYDWDDSYLYGGLGSHGYWNCHRGNTKLLSSGKGQGGILFIGGWSRGADHTDLMTVFDLTGRSAPKTHTGNYYQIAIEDFDVPLWSLFFWESLAMNVYDELQYGDVLIACQGGHGRSGLFSAIIAYMLVNKRHIRIVEKELLESDPLAWIRQVHCHQAVETVSQEICVYETCIAHKSNDVMVAELERIRSRPRRPYKPVNYVNTVKGYVNDEVDEDDGFICPICLKEHHTMIHALACCNTSTSLRYCPVCLTKHDLPVDAYNCCRTIPLA